MLYKMQKIISKSSLFAKDPFSSQIYALILHHIIFQGKGGRNTVNDELIWNNYRRWACWPAEGQNLRTYHSADGFVLASAKSIVVRCQFLDAQGLVGSAAALYRFARHLSKPATLMSWLPTQMLQMCLVTYQHFYAQSSYQLGGFLTLFMYLWLFL